MTTSVGEDAIFLKAISTDLAYKLSSEAITSFLRVKRQSLSNYCKNQCVVFSE